MRKSARAVLRPRPDDVPVITTSFLSPNLSLASMRRRMLLGVGIFQLAMNLKLRRARARRSARGYHAGGVATVAR